MNRRSFDEAISRAIAREHLTDSGSKPLDVVLRGIAHTAPGSTAQDDVVVVARLVFDELDRGTDGAMIPWSGPPCPACGAEMNAEIISTSRGLKASERCPRCDLVLLIPDLFTA